MRDVVIDPHVSVDGHRLFNLGLESSIPIMVSLGCEYEGTRELSGELTAFFSDSSVQLIAEAKSASKSVDAVVFGHRGPLSPVVDGIKFLHEPIGQLCKALRGRGWDVRTMEDSDICSLDLGMLIVPYRPNYNRIYSVAFSRRGYYDIFF